MDKTRSTIGPGADKTRNTIGHGMESYTVVLIML